MEKEIQRILDEHCDWTPKRIEGLKKELLNLFSVSGMFSEEQMEKAYNDGAEAEEQRCGYFDIENYR